AAANLFRQIKLCRASDGMIVPATSDRFDSYSPAWGADGKWLYLLSDRNLKTIVESPWGNYQPEPFLDKTTKIYQLALIEGLRSPFAPADELHPKEEEKKESSTQPTSTAASSSQPASAPASQRAPAEVKIELAGLASRLIEVPLPPGNYGG